MSDAQSLPLSPYSPLWPAIFDMEKRNLERLLGEAVLVEHIGSTAVPGMGAKPIIDMMAGTPDLAIVDRRIPELVADGWRYNPELEVANAQRRHFSRLDGAPGKFILHAVVLDSPFWKRHLAFRDALRADPALADKYWRLKQRLAARFPNDRAAYNDGKSEFVRSVIEASR